jgi:osmoprotectant transport system ATP-binding protein
MSVARNNGIVPTLAQWDRARVAARTHELLELVGLPDHYATRFPDELSGGERQRVGVARALALDPPVLLMDEPFGSLDPVTRAGLHREFKAIQARLCKTVMLVTHDIGEAFALGDRVGVIEGGRLIAWGLPREISASGDSRVRLFLDALALPPEDR